SEIILSLCALALAIWGLAVFGSDDAARDEVILRLCLAGVSLLILILLYLRWFKRLPEEWDEEAHRKLSELEERLKPRLKFTWRPNDNKYLERIDCSDALYAIR
ncbi:MAG TPA: hypothetical protein VFO09_01330, partial [Methyloceanibacter sp.]|nr:hypothetical protein [Methyloceanibacter sp.]